jgi:hypothetical protein
MPLTNTFPLAGSRPAAGGRQNVESRDFSLTHSRSLWRKHHICDMLCAYIRHLVRSHAETTTPV